MTRLAITLAILAAVLLIALNPAPRPAQLDIPGAVFSGEDAGSATGNPAARTGAPETHLGDHIGSRPRPGAPPFTLPAPRPQRHADKPGVRSSIPAPTKRPRPLRVQIESSRPAYSLTGTASWFCLPGSSACTSGYGASGAYAAAGPRLRAALEDWRGRTVLVTADGASVRVRLIDWCACDGGYLLDLYGSVFGQLARNGLSQGVVEVTVTW